MKKLLFFVLTLCLLGCFVGCGQTGMPNPEAATADPEAVTTDTPEPIAGGWTGNREITDEEIAIFNEAMAGQVGLYIPNFVATQVVAGTNYRFAATMHVDSSGNNLPFGEDVYIFIFKPLEGPAELVNIENVAAQ